MRRRPPGPPARGAAAGRSRTGVRAPIRSASRMVPARVSARFQGGKASVRFMFAGVGGHAGQDCMHRGQRHEQRDAAFLLVRRDADHAEAGRAGGGLDADTVAEPGSGGVGDILLDDGDVGSGLLLGGGVPASGREPVVEHRRLFPGSMRQGVQAVSGWAEGPRRTASDCRPRLRPRRGRTCRRCLTEQGAAGGSGQRDDPFFHGRREARRVSENRRRITSSFPRAGSPHLAG